VIIRTIDVGEQMIAVREVDFDWSHGGLSWVLCASRHKWTARTGGKGPFSPWLTPVVS
jgi:hypothetical protein